MSNAIITHTESVKGERESDGRFALKMANNKTVQRMMRADAEREARRRQNIEECGEDEMLWA